MFSPYLPAKDCSMSSNAEQHSFTIDLKTDNHVHTSLCNHALGTMEEYVLAAIRGGLETITFLEHLEAGIAYFERTWLTEADFARYFEEGSRLRRKYRDSIRVRLGVEVGFNPQALPELEERLNCYEWDIKGLSYHFFFAGGKHLNMVSRRPENLDALAALGPENVLTAYFTQLTEAIELLDCQVLCHLDAVMRHYKGLEFGPVHLEAIDHLLALLKRKKMYLEVNTSGFALRGEPYPGRDILAQALKRGIPLSAGSDAHRPEQVGRHFDLLPAYLSGIGQPVDTDPANDVKPTA